MSAAPHASRTHALRKLVLESAGAALAAVLVYLVLAFTGLSSADMVRGETAGPAASAEPAAMALGALDQAYRTTGDALPPFAPSLPLSACPSEPRSAEARDLPTPALRSPVLDAQRLTL